MSTQTAKNRPLTEADIYDALNDGSISAYVIRTLKPEAAERETKAHGADVRFVIKAVDRRLRNADGTFDVEPAAEVLDYARVNLVGLDGVFVSATYAQTDTVSKMYVGGTIREAPFDTIMEA